MSIVRNHDHADEALQECLVRVYRHLDKLQELEKFPGWLARMAVNQCRTQLTHAGSRALYELDETYEVPNDALVAAAQAPVSPRAAAQGHELRSEIDAAIAELPEKQRISIMLFEVEQMSIKEISEALECSEGAIKFNIHEARKKLRHLLSHHSSAERRA